MKTYSLLIFEIAKEIIRYYSRRIIAWKLSSSMTAEDLKATIDIAIKETGFMTGKVLNRLRLLSENEPCYISGELKNFLESQCQLVTI